MGSYIGTLHQHDMPKPAMKQDKGRVWQCDCGEQFYVNGDLLVWLPVNPKTDTVTLDPKE